MTPPGEGPLRHRAAGRGRLRTVVVAWLRVLLPLAALVILSTLFLLSRRPEPDAAIPYARVDAEARARAPQMTAPTYAGVTSDGATIALSADSATPTRDGGIGGASTLKLDWRAVDGFGVQLSAPRAVMGAQAITLDGGVRITTSTGWTVTAPQMVAETDRSALDATGGVDAAAPFGTVRADALSIRRQPGPQQGGMPDHLLDFTGGVRLLYLP